MNNNSETSFLGTTVRITHRNDFTITSLLHRRFLRPAAENTGKGFVNREQNTTQYSPILDNLHCNRLSANKSLASLAKGHDTAPTRRLGRVGCSLVYNWIAGYIYICPGLNSGEFLAGLSFAWLERVENPVNGNHKLLRAVKLGNSAKYNMVVRGRLGGKNWSSSSICGRPQVYSFCRAVDK